MEPEQSAEHAGNNLPYMPQLDSLRTFAVLGVLVHHFMNVEALPWKFLHLPWGHLGVRLFFVLSGFLITGILLNCRETADASGQRWFLVRQFYIRRFLRIFPLYYFVLFAAFLLNIPPVREVFFWLLTYTTNFYVAAQGKWLPQVGHLWTLAVEEQFYLVWPWLVLFAPRKWLLPSIAGIVLLGPLYRWFAVAHGINPIATYSFTFACMDTLGMGALLAMVTRHVSRQQLRRWMDRIVLPAGVLGTAALHLSASYDMRPNTVLLDLALSVVFCWLIFRASEGFHGVAGRLLEMKPLVYCGRISYGIYIYHFFIPLLLWPALNKLSITPLQWQLLSFTLGSLVTLILAMLSWHFFEKPINNLKRLANYSPSFVKPAGQPHPAVRRVEGEGIK